MLPPCGLVMYCTLRFIIKGLLGSEMVYIEIKGPPLPDHLLSQIFAGQTLYKHISEKSITPQVSPY